MPFKKNWRASRSTRQERLNWGLKRLRTTDDFVWQAEPFEKRLIVSSQPSVSSKDMPYFIMIETTIRLKSNSVYELSIHRQIW